MAAPQLIPGQRLKPTDEQREKLGKLLVDRCSQLERDNKEFLRRIDLWWSWHEAEPLSSKRTTPFNGASNIVVPLIAIHADAIKSRFVNTIFGAPDLWWYRVRNDANRDLASSVIDHLNWASDDNEFDIFTPSASSLDECTVVGSSVKVLTWTSRKRWVFVPGEGGRPEPRAVELGRGPLVQHFPRDQVLWQYSKPINDAECVFVQVPSTWTDLTTWAQFDEIDADQLEHVQPMSSGAGGPSTMTRNLQRQAGQDDHDNLYDIRQAYVEWPVLRGLRFEDYEAHDWNTPILPLVVTFDYTSGTVLAVRAKPYYTRGWPLYEDVFRSQASHRNPGGVAKMLEPMQRAATIMLNQAIDTITLANSLTLMTTDRRLLTQQFTPGRPLFTEAYETTRELTLNKLIAPDISLINLVMAMAERRTGINDPSLGREIRYGGHPSPATSTAIMLQESKEMFRSSMKAIRQSYGRLGEDIATLYQQFEGYQNGGVIERALGTANGETLKQWQYPLGPIAGTIEFDLRAMSEQINPEADREQAVFIMQSTTAYYSQVLQALQIAAHPQTPPIAKAAAIKSIEALTTGMSRLLESGRVEDMHKLLFDLRESGNGAETIQRTGAAVTDQLRGLVEDRGSSPLPPIAARPNQLPNGANGAVLGGGV